MGGERRHEAYGIWHMAYERWHKGGGIWHMKDAVILNLFTKIVIRYHLYCLFSLHIPYASCLSHMPYAICPMPSPICHLPYAYSYLNASMGLSLDALYAG